MSRIQPIEPNDATGVVQETFDTIKQRFGMLPSFFLTSGVSPAFSKGHLDLMLGLDLGGLPAGLREQIAIGTAQFNGCQYCLSAHTVVATKWAKIDANEARLARRFMASDPKEQACLSFAKAVLDTQGGVSDSDLADVRAAGFSDAEIGAIIGEVVVNIMRNYFNRTAQTDLDSFFPLIDPARLDVDVPLVAELTN